MNRLQMKLTKEWANRFLHATAHISGRIVASYSSASAPFGAMNRIGEFARNTKPLTSILFLRSLCINCAILRTPPFPPPSDNPIPLCKHHNLMQQLENASK